MKQLVLVSKRTDDKSFARKLAAELKLELQQFQTVDGALSGLEKKEPPAALLLDGGDAGSLRQFWASALANSELPLRKLHPNYTHLLIDDRAAAWPDLLGFPFAGHVVERGSDFTSEFAAAYARVLAVTIVQGKNAWDYLSAEAKAHQEVALKSGADRRRLTGAVKRVAGLAGFSARSGNQLAQVVDELLLNAVFRANPSANPVPDLKQVISDFSLSGKSVVTLRIGYDGRGMLLDVCDHFGSLRREQLLLGMAGLTVPGRQTNNAVNGIRLIGGAPVSLLFHVRPGESTEAFVFLAKTKAQRDLRGRSRFLSFIDSSLG